MSVFPFQGLLSDLELSRLVLILCFLSLKLSASSMDHTSPSPSSPPPQTHHSLPPVFPVLSLPTASPSTGRMHSRHRQTCYSFILESSLSSPLFVALV